MGIKRVVVAITFMIVFGVLLLVSCGGKKSIKSETTGLSALKLANGDYQIENAKMKIVVSPKYGGRVLSVFNKVSGEETIEPLSPSNISTGGAFYDIVNLVWPGSAELPYSIKEIGLSKDEKTIAISMTYSVGEKAKDKRGLLITKTLTVDNFSAVVHSQVDICNLSADTIEFTYWHQSRPTLGKAEEGSRITWLSIEDDIVEIPFSPGSGGHGTTMHPTDGFAGLTAKDAKSSIVWLFDKKKIQYYWTWHDVQIPTYDLLFKPVRLIPSKSVSYKMDMVLLPDMKSITGGDYKTGLVGGIIPKYEKGKLFVEGEIYKYNQDKYTGLKLKVEILDAVGNPIQTIKDQLIPAIHAEQKIKFSAEAKVSSRVKGGYYKVLVTLVDNSGKELFRSQRYVKMGKITIPRSGKPLTLVFMWELHQPIYPDLKVSRKNLRGFVNIYRKIAKLYEKHPRIKTDFCMSGALLYQLAQFYPDVIEKYKALNKKKTINIIATGFGHALFPFISKEEISYQIKMDREIKNFIFGRYPTGIHIPEMAFTNGVIGPMMLNEIRYGYFSRLAIDKGYKNMPDIDYRKPSKIISQSGVINALIRDPDAVNILLKKTDRSVDEFIQYLMKIQETNDGSLVVVVANNGEFMGGGKYMDKVFTALEKIRWIKFKTGEEVFRKVQPTQTFLAEKIYGSWYYDIEKQESSLRLWMDTEIKQKIWEELQWGQEVILRVNEKINRAKELAGIDVSYPRMLFDKAWEHLLLAEQSDWIWAGSEESANIAKKEIHLAKTVTAEVYDTLMSILKDEQLAIPYITEVAEVLPETECDKMLTKISSGKFKVWDVKLTPKAPSATSALNLRFKIYDAKNGVDYNNVYVVYRINNTDKYYKIKAKLAFDGSMKAFLGKGRVGYKVEYFIYASDRKKNESVSALHKFEVSE